jgi:hypothetical protein
MNKWRMRWVEHVTYMKGIESEYARKILAGTWKKTNFGDLSLDGK